MKQITSFFNTSKRIVLNKIKSRATFFEWRELPTAPSELAKMLSPVFDAEWYAERYLTEKRMQIEPVLHFKKYYKAGNYSPCLLFDCSYYIRKYVDVADAGVNPLLHYLSIGHKEGRQPHPLFDINYYARHYYNALRATKLDPLSHFLTFGLAEDLDPNPYFDSRWYRTKYMKDQEFSSLALEHYINIGEQLDYKPCKRFDPKVYRELNRVALKERSDGGTVLGYFLESSYHKGTESDYYDTYESAKDLRESRDSVKTYNKFPSNALLTCPVLSIRDYMVRKENRGEFLISYESSAATGVHKKLKFPGPSYVVRLSDMMVIGGTRYMLGEDDLLHDEEFAFRDAEDADVKWNDATRLQEGLLSIRLVVKSGAWLDAGINMMHEYSANYFHFIAETIPRMMLLEEAAIPAKVPFLFEEGLHENIIRMIEVLNIKKRPILFLRQSEMYSVRSLYFPSDMSSVIDAYDAGPELNDTALAVEYIKKGITICQNSVIKKVEHGRKRKIYLSRTNGARTLDNEKMLITALIDEDFEILSTEGLDLDSQIKIFREASVLVGPTGANLANLVWCEPGTVIYVLASDHPSHQLYFWKLLAQVSGVIVKIIQGPRSYDVVGKYAVHDNYKVDIDVILNKLKNSSPE